MQKPNLLDLFCGAGGLSHGFAQAGFSVLAGIDSDKDSLMTFQTNHPESHTIEADIQELSPEKLEKYLDIQPGVLDCIVGGPPCQGFSKNRAYRHQNGTFVDDPRNHLYWHFFEFVEYFQPKAVLMENVPEILTKSNGHFRDMVFEKFNELKYSVQDAVIDASKFGVPQKRRRAFFMAVRGLNQKVVFPKETTLSGNGPGRRTPNSVDDDNSRQNARCHTNPLPFCESLSIGPSVWDAISDLHGLYASDFHGFSDYATIPQTNYQIQRREEDAEKVTNHFPWKLSERQLQRIRLLKEGQGQLHLPKELQTKNGYGSAYRRLQSNAQALTITTWMFHPGSGMFTHPFEDRVITIREAARLQSFQDSFVFCGRYHAQCKQVGNSVAPLVAKSLAKSLLNLIGMA